ncbi:MAG: antitoxin [Solirubrobacteraceae bacterium]
MGFGDKLKGLRDQAQQTVAENKDKIQDAVQVVGEAANSKTHGKYATKIAQVGEKVSGGVGRFAEGAGPAEDAPAGAAAPGAAAPAADAPAPDAPAAGQADASAAPIADEQPGPVTPSAAGEAASDFPEFE